LKLSFEGQHVLVTGASKGIGASTARLFGELGARVTVHFNRDEVGASDVVSAVRANGVEAHAIGADLAKWDDAEALCAKAEVALGPLDVVVMNHGIWRGTPIEAMDEREYDAMLDANLRGMFALAGAAARRMKPRKKGNLVLVASTAGQRGESGCSHYAATKGGIISLTKSLAVELSPENIRVNCVAPGWVDTSMTHADLVDPVRGPKIRATIPMGRAAYADEIAGPIAFVASAWAGFMTGEILNVNGGAVLCG
jgi:3-oxoacyl-[acyl-carrier protein] reductase